MSDETLILVHAIFRHGERTTDKRYQYKNDPHIGEEFDPIGHAQLTNVGRKTMYDLGKNMREVLDDFLGDLYIPKYVEALSSAAERAKCSLQLVLASLFPPKGENVWCENLNWQPIAFTFDPPENDEIFLSVLNKKFVEVYMQNYLNVEGQRLLQEHKETFDYLRKHTGEEMRFIREVWILLSTLATEEEFGLKLPEWTKCVYPGKLYEIALKEYRMQTATNELKRLITGKLLLKILQDTKAKVDKKSECKIHLYSGHDFNVAPLLIFFGVMYPHFPSNGACVLLEIYERGAEHFLKLRYKESKRVDFSYLKFSDGKDIMNLREFQRMVLDLFE